MTKGRVEIISKNKILTCKDYNSYENRGVSIIKLFEEAYINSSKPDFKLTINTEDLPENSKTKNILNFCSKAESTLTVPDFLFENWKEVGIPDYSETIEKLWKIGQLEPITNKLGWIGVLTSQPRRDLVNILDPEFEFIPMLWNHSNGLALNKNTTQYISISEQVKRWRYLIDLEGITWSTRLKLFLFSNRVTFVVDRAYKEFWHFNLEPWVHYIPVKRDLSNLKENFYIVKNNPKLEEEVKINAYNFAINNLKREHAIKRYTNLINTFN